MLPDISEILHRLSQVRCNLTNEKITQQQLFAAVKEWGFVREFRLDDQNIPDLFAEGIAVEIKIKGQKMAIYRQVARYAQFDQVTTIILASNKNMQLPATINGKKAYFIHIGKAWL